MHDVQLQFPHTVKNIIARLEVMLYNSELVPRTVMKPSKQITHRPNKNKTGHIGARSKDSVDLA